MSSTPPHPTTATLRVLQTTDLHMSFAGHNYFGAQDTAPSGLFSLAPVIQAARADGLATVLLDCGDFLHGTPLADEIAARDLKPHPIVRAFGLLGYDAIALGNHDFEFGLPYLSQTLTPCAEDVVATNVRTSPTEHFANPWKIINRQIACSDGQTRTVRIGIMGFAPPQITDWSAEILGGALVVEDAVSAARTHLPQIRRAGADIVIALCHGGPSAEFDPSQSENPAAALAALPGIDAVLMGHLHRSFPGEAFKHLPQVDGIRATINGTPAMMPAAHAEQLGQMDLTLCLDASATWRVSSHDTKLLAPDPETAVMQTDLARHLSPDLAAVHQATVARLAQTVCDTPVPLNSFFAAIGHDETADLLARVQANLVRDGLRDTAFASLPLLSSTASFAAGGHAGSQNFVDIARGALRLRDCTALAPFENRICAVLRRGWQIRDWLERTSGYFNRLIPGKPNQELISGHVASYHFDTIHGLRYTIDLSVDPADTHGADGQRARIRDITLNDEPLHDDALVAVATSAYRARGGGSLVRAAEPDIVFTSRVGVRTALIADLKSGRIAPRKAVGNWRFAPLDGATATFQSAAKARDHVTQVTGLKAGDPTGDGFAQFHLTL